MSRWQRSRGHAPRLLFAAFALLGSMSGLAAQANVEPGRDAPEIELERLVPLLNRLGDRAQAAERLRRHVLESEAEALTDTFSVGPFRVMAVPEQRELAEEVIQHAWTELESLITGSEELLHSHTFLIHHYWHRDGRIPRVDSNVRRVDMSMRYSRAHLERKAVETVGSTLLAGAPYEITEWAGGQPWVPLSRLPWVARELIATPSQAVKRCYRGELSWCLEAMGVGGTEGGWSRWYSPEEQRYYIRSRTGPGGASSTAIWEGCVYQGMDEACEVFLRDREPLIPLSPMARASLLGHVLKKGGSGAFQRLRAAEGASIVDRLAAAAQETPEEFLASWRQEVLQAQPSVWAGLARSPVGVLFWFLLFGALALRSTRWRLG